MIRRAFMMQLKPGGLAEYKKHHDEIWPELVAEIEKSGIARITIFEKDPVLILYSEIYDEAAWDKLWHSEVHDRWAEVMNPLMKFRDDGIVESTTVTEIFHLETNAGKQG
jgi:L-rhamnose mutarotase